MAFVKALKVLMIGAHRYIGIPLSFMFVIWFVSAFFMIYAGGMPRITPAMRADSMQTLDFSQVKISPRQASLVAGETGTSLSMRSILGRAVYQFGEGGYGPVFVAADNAEVLAALDTRQGAELAADFLGLSASQFQYLDSISEPDQWTLTEHAMMPLYRYQVDDGLGTEVYVSPDNRQVSVYTTRQSRLLAWLGTIPHWLYFVSLRNNQPLWYDILVYAAYAGCVLALLGLCLSVTQLRKVRPFSLKQAIPYRGAMRWHYMLGTVFGVFTLTWVFSGLVSMEPWSWTNSSGVRVSRDLYLDSDVQLGNFDRWQQINAGVLAQHNVKELEFRHIGGQPFLLATHATSDNTGDNKRDRLHQPYNINRQLSAASLTIAADSGTEQRIFASQFLVEQLASSVPQVEVSDQQLLQNYDDYYYSRQGQLPLPVLRVKLNDSAASWLYIDPQRAELLSVVDRYSRLERWLYSGLHSLDFAFWYHQRPLWDLVVLLLLSGGLGVSLLGLLLGLKRIRRDIAALSFGLLVLNKNEKNHVTD